jgi:hypothetical protein
VPSSLVPRVDLVEAPGGISLMLRHKLQLVLENRRTDWLWLLIDQPLNAFPYWAKAITIGTPEFTQFKMVSGHEGMAFSLGVMN